MRVNIDINPIYFIQVLTTTGQIEQILQMKAANYIWDTEYNLQLSDHLLIYTIPEVETAC